MRPSFTLVLICAAACGAAPEHATAAAAPLPTAGYLVYVRDREGSVLAAVDDHGKTLSVAEDDGFGLRLSGTGTPVPREFLDKELDEETGYYHFQARYYDPASAQWLSPDPKLLTGLDCSQRVQGCNPYAFAGNRPLEWTDQEGREIVTFHDADGTPTMLITAGFYGPGAANARDVFLQGVVNLRGSVRVVALTAVYKTGAEVPKGLTGFDVNRDYLRSDGAHSSETDSDLSTIHLSLSALKDDAPEEGRSAEMLHEVLHAAGRLGEGYFYAFEHGHSWPGHIDGFGGDYWNNPSATHLTDTEAHQLMSPEAPGVVNSGTNANDPSFLTSPTFKAGAGGGNQPSGEGVLTSVSAALF